MKTVLVIALALLTTSAQADTYVQGHTRSDGTYVQGHMRSSPNGYQNDNYSTRGNTNPYTGQQGTRRSYTTYGAECTGWC